jgi:hypothetical protein
MNEREILEQQKKLRAVPDDEWRQALKECAAYITWKTWGQTSSGCHSELELAEPASEHYTEEAMMKLWEGDRTWKPGLSLKEQLIEVAHGMISNEPVTYGRRGWRKVSIERELTPTGTGLMNDGSEIRGDEDDSCGFDVEDKDESMEVTYDRAKAAVKGNKRLEAYVDAIQRCNNFDEICSDLNITKKQAYKLQSELMERLRKNKLK